MYSDFLCCHERQFIRDTQPADIAQQPQPTPSPVLTGATQEVRSAHVHEQHPL